MMNLGASVDWNFDVVNLAVKNSESETFFVHVG